jgi:hypothetical protein
MQITINQDELEIAVRDYIVKQGITRPVGEINFTVQRSPSNPILTEITLGEFGQDRRAPAADPRPTAPAAAPEKPAELKAVEAPAAAAKAPAAKEKEAPSEATDAVAPDEEPAPKGKSLFG